MSAQAQQNVTAGTLPAPEQAQFQDCFACRAIGTATLGTVGLYALNMSRAHQPGSVIGKRIMGGVGICFLIGGYMRWTSVPPAPAASPVVDSSRS